MATNDAMECSSDLSPSALFARELKTYETRSFLTYTDVNIVVAFDTKKFNDKCQRNSANYDSSLCFDAIADELFKPDEIWLDRALIKTAIDTLAALHGWTAMIKRNNLQCNRFGEDTSKRNYASGALKVGCSFYVALKSLYNIRTLNESKMKYDYAPDWSNPVMIKKAVCRHGDLCNPGKQNRIATVQRAGKYVEQTNEYTMFLLCNYAEDGKISSSIIKKTLSRVWPKSKVIRNSDVFNVRVKVARLLKTFKSVHRKFEDFKNLINPSDLLQGIDNEISIDDDEAYQLAQSLWTEVMNTHETKEDALFSFIDYLELLSARAKGFVYKLAQEESTVQSGRKKLIGVMWQTATMRRNFELFGDFISLDMMKRALNKFLWPYAGVAMYDESKHLCIACEGVLCGERVDMYKFIADFLSTCTPKRTLAQVNIVAGDAFFTPEMIKEIGFVNANFILDRWHLLESGLEKLFGKGGYSILQGHLVGMVNADSESEFDSYYSSGKKLLQSMEHMNLQLEKDLDDFAERRDNYANFALASIPGNRGILGSGSSEQNHSSVLVYLNEGEKGKNGYFGSVADLTKDLMGRQDLHVAKTNTMLYNMCQIMDVERRRLEKAIQTEINRDLLAASKELNHPSYERYKSRRLRADKDYYASVTVDNISNQAITLVHRRNSDVNPFIFRTPNQRCMCTERLKEEDMCVHEIVAKGGFDKSLFKECHLRRSKVFGSLEGWSASLVNPIDNIVGYHEEVMMPSSPSNSPVLAQDPDGDCVKDGQFGVIGNNGDNALGEAQLFQEKDGVCKPLSTREAKSTLGTVSNAYSGLDDELKFKVSALMLQMEELIITKGNSTEVQSREGKYSAMKPSQSNVARQSKTRLKSSRENASRKKSKLIDKNLQKVGVKQVIAANDEYEVQVNGKTAAGKCGFCQLKHRITTCQRLAALKMTASMYVLSTNDRYYNNEELLRSRIHKTMYHSASNIKAFVSKLDTTSARSNIIIHQACINGENRLYRVSFLSEFAEEGDELWISWEVMNKIITHKLKKIKYVFDKTKSHEQGMIIGTASHSRGAQNTDSDERSDESDEDEEMLTLEEFGRLQSKRSDLCSPLS